MSEYRHRSRTAPRRTCLKNRRFLIGVQRRPSTFNWLQVRRFLQRFRSFQRQAFSDCSASKKKMKKGKSFFCRSRGRAELAGLRDPAYRTGGSHTAHRRLQRSFLYDFAAIARGFADLDFDHFHDKLSAKVLHRKRRRSIMFFLKMSFSRSRAARRTLGSASRTGDSHKAQLHPATVIPQQLLWIFADLDFDRFNDKLLTEILQGNWRFVTKYYYR